MEHFGTTATQVSPKVTEQEISMVHEIFSRLANTIVEASKAGSELAAMRSELEGLRVDIEYVRKRNRELDEEVTEVRRQRDEAIRERDEAQARVKELKDNEFYNGEELARLRRDLEEAQASNVSLRRERDDYGMRNIELDEKVAKFREWSDNLTKLLSNVPVL